MIVKHNIRRSTHFKHTKQNIEKIGGKSVSQTDTYNINGVIFMAIRFKISSNLLYHWEYYGKIQHNIN